MATFPAAGQLGSAHYILALQVLVCAGVLVEALNLALHLGNLRLQVRVLLANEAHIVRQVLNLAKPTVAGSVLPQYMLVPQKAVYLAARALVLLVNTHHTLTCHWTVSHMDVCVQSNSRVHCCCCGIVIIFGRSP